MLVIPQAEMDAILNPRIKRRTLRLPVRRETLRTSASHPRLKRTLTVGKEAGGQAEKRCPLTINGNYAIRGDGIEQRYEQLRREAKSQPSSARAIVWLLLRAEDETRELRITVREIRREKDEWIVRFIMDSKAERRDALDDSVVFLRRGGGYTTTYDEIDAGAVMPPLAKDLEEARKAAREGRIAPARVAVDDLAKRATKCVDVMTSMKARNRARLIVKETEKLQRELAAEASATLQASTVAKRTSGEDAPQPRSASRGVEKCAA